MKMLLSAALLVSLSGAANAVHLPNDVDKIAMGRALAAARTADTDRALKLREYRRVTLAGGFSPSEIQKAESAWRLAENKRVPAANAALAAIIKAYDIHPDKESTPAAAGLYENRTVRWSPEFGEMRLDHVYLDGNGKKIGEDHLDPNTDYSGITWADGKIVITPAVLFETRSDGTPSFSPGMIAAIIYHETIHFNQLTDPIRAKHMSTAAMEFAAHTSMQVHQAEFELTKGEMDFISDRLQKSLDINLKNPNVLMIGAVKLEPTAIDENDDNGEAAFIQGLRQITPVTKVDRDAFAAQESEAEARWKNDPEYIAYKARSDAYERWGAEARARDAAQERERVEHFAEMRRRWEYLKTMTGLACSNPDALERLGLEGKVPGVSISDLDLEWEMSRTEGMGKKERPVVNSCQKYILSSVRNSNDLVRGRELLAWAREYREQHPSLLARFTTGIGDLFSAMGEAGDGGGNYSNAGARRTGSTGYVQTDADREQWQRSMEAQRLAGEEAAAPVHEVFRHSPDNWSSLNQLRGIAGH